MRSLRRHAPGGADLRPTALPGGMNRSVEIGLGCAKLGVVTFERPTMQNVFRPEVVVDHWQRNA